MKKTIYLFILLFSISHTYSQQVFPGESMILESRNLRCYFTNAGDVWGNIDTLNYSKTGMEYPKNSNTVTKCLFNSGFWLSGKENTSSAKTSCLIFKSLTPVFFPGPIDKSTGEATTLSSSTFNKIWKVSKADLNNFQNLIINNPLPLDKSKIENNILTWPAKGNSYYKNSYDIIDDLAPFNDVNKNGIYDPENGDFPKIKGDTAFFTVMNDYSKFRGLGVELHLMAYVIDAEETANTIFYDLTITKKSEGDFSEFIFGLFVDADLGYPNDDYIGCDSNQNMAYVYNGSIYDPSLAGNNGYGLNPPIVAIKFLNKKMSSFNYFNNNPAGPLGTPTTEIEHYNYLTGKSRLGTNMTVGGDGTSGTIPTNFVFSSDPCDEDGWSMYSEQLSPLDLRFIMNSEPVALSFNQPEEYHFKVSVFNQDTWPPCISETVLPEDSLVVEKQETSTKCNLSISKAKITSDVDNKGEGSIEITIESSGTYKAKWSSGEKNKSKIVRKSAGDYSILIYGENNCFLDSIFTIENKSSGGGTGNASISLVSNNNIEIYPIPAKNELSIDFNNNEKIDRISIFDLNGKVIKTMSIDTYVSHYDIPLTELAKGVYLLKIEGESIHQTSKFTKE